MRRRETGPRVNVILVALGSHGDVHPLVGIGRALLGRGHRVMVVASAYFGPLIEAEGLELIPLGTAEEYRQLAADPNMWRRFRGTLTAFRKIGQFTRPVDDAIASHCVPGQTIVGASTLALGARVAEDHLGVPTASIHLQPSLFLSAIDPPHLQGLFMPRWMPHWMRRAQYAAVDKVVDSLAAPALNAFRREKGLPPVRRILSEYVHSPRRVIGLFPEWYAPPASDWPRQTRLTGFPLYDERGISQMPDELLRFLDNGGPPIAFTPGSAMWSGHRFLAESAKACALLGRRGLLLTRHHDHLPRHLPPGVRHFEFAPFSQLLPQCAALVHHGGIGTSAQALATGVPQLVMPHSHDQPHNAARLVRLGVARQLSPARYRAARVARELSKLLGSPAVSEACRSASRRFAGANPINASCDLIEDLAEPPATAAHA